MVSLKKLILLGTCCGIVIGCSDKKEEQDEFRYYETEQEHVSGSRGEDNGGNSKHVSAVDEGQQNKEPVREEVVTLKERSVGLGEETSGQARNAEEREVVSEGKHRPRAVERSGLNLGSVAAGVMMGSLLNSGSRDTKVIHVNSETSTPVRELSRRKTLQKVSKKPGKKKTSFFKRLKKTSKRSTRSFFRRSKSRRRRR